MSDADFTAYVIIGILIVAVIWALKGPSESDLDRERRKKEKELEIKRVQKQIDETRSRERQEPRPETRRGYERPPPGKPGRGKVVKAKRRRRWF